MLLFKYGHISFEPVGMFWFSFWYTSPKNKCDQQTKYKKVPKELLYIPFNENWFYVKVRAVDSSILLLSNCVLNFNLALMVKVQYSPKSHYSPYQKT